MPTWQSLSSAMEMQSSDCFLSTQAPTKTDNFESAMSSMVSSPAASNSALSNDNFMIRELIGKLGNICNSGDISTGGHHGPPPYIGGGNGGGNCSTNNSCYSTPLSSPPKMGMSMPIMDHLVKENFPTLGNSIALRSNFPAMPSDPGFAERAARFSSFGSRSFNGRTSQFVVNNNKIHNHNNNHGNDNNAEFGYRSNNSNLVGNGKLQRVSSSPSLKEVGSQVEKNKNSLLLQNNERNQAGNCGPEHGDFSNSRENSSISGQNPVGENGSTRKRKAPAPKGKTKETLPHSPLHTNKVTENGEDSSAKRTKSEEGGVSKTEDNQKPPEAPKDYIHVRARRGQATDSHSLAERVRREKIGERMKLLQDLVPGCDKLTGKALMLDEIINYVQSLQRQVEFLSMKLSTVNPRLEFNMENLFSKDVIQPNCSLTHPMYPLDSMAPTLYHQNSLQDSITTTAPCHMDPLHLPSLDGFPNCLPQLSSLCEGDLQSIVQMGFGQKENGFQLQQPLHGSNPSSLMKIEF
ncbi:hypothetical protein SOVF_055290 [Spinacia oleracea]|nr:hypothetical protein SOVF_055290 [Spinacia oleracea]